MLPYQWKLDADDDDPWLIRPKLSFLRMGVGPRSAEPMVWFDGDEYPRCDRPPDKLLNLLIHRGQLRLAAPCRNYGGMVLLTFAANPACWTIEDVCQLIGNLYQSLNPPEGQYYFAGLARLDAMYGIILQEDPQ